MQNNIFAAIDIGTNTFRLLIAEVRKNDEGCSLREVHTERIITRLGDGISHNRLISEGSMQRGLDALDKFSRIISKSKVAKISVVATSALREAENNLEFITKAKKVSGLDISIITGEDEAKMTAAGMMLDLDVPDSALLLDIGGGSTELIYTEKKEPAHMQSLNLGVVYLASKYMTEDPPSAEMIHMMEKGIMNTIVSRSGAPDRASQTPTCLIGTAGTVTALAAVSLGLSSFDRSKIHGTVLSLSAIKDIFSRIALISSEERSAHIPFEPERLDIIVPGTLILLKLMEQFHFDEITVSDYGLREGIILDLCHKGNRKDT